MHWQDWDSGGGSISFQRLHYEALRISSRLVRSPYDKADSPNLKLHQQQAATTLFEKKIFPKTCIHASFNGKYEDRRIGDFLHDSPYLSNFYFFGYFFGGGCDFCVNFLFYKIKWSLVQYNKRKYNTDRTQLTFSVGLIKYKHVYLVIEVKSYPCA